MDWKILVRVTIIVILLFLLGSSFAGCKNETGSVIDWDDCSQQIGDHPCDFSLLDQDGNQFNLYDHHGKIIILDFSAMWCGPCMMAATEVEHLQEKYGDKIVYVTILIENENGNQPSTDDLKRWADHFGIESAPVLGGSRSLISSDPSAGWAVGGWPQFYIIDQDLMLVQSFKGFSRGLIETIILAYLE